MDRSQFLAKVKAAFPEVADDLNAQGGLLHFEMDAFRYFTDRMISAGEKTIVAQIYSLVDEAYSNGDNKLKNAIDVSFVEPLDFSDTKKKSRGWAWEALPPRLQQLYVAFHGEKPST